MYNPVSLHRPPPLIRPVGWILAGLAVIVPLIVLFHNPDRLIGLLRTRGSDSLAFRYLELMVGMKPEDVELRLMLTRRLKEIGKLEEARRTLTPLLANADIGHNEAELLGIQIDYSALIALKESDPNRASAEENLIHRLQDFPEHGATRQGLEDFAKISLALNRPGLAAEFYLKLSETDPANKPSWLKESARWFTASGNGAKAGLLLDQASSTEPDPIKSRGLALEALATLRGAMAFDPALKLAGGYLEKFPEDRELTGRAIDLALAAGRLDLAQACARKLASIARDDPDALKRQLEIDLWANDLTSALATSLALTTLDPENPDYRARVAQMAAWANRPELALEQRLWLAQHGVLGENLVEGQKLAIGTHNDSAWLRLTELQAQHGALSDSQLADAVTIYQRSSRADRLEEFLTAYVSRNPQARKAWVALAQVQQRNGNPQRALATWARVDREFGATLESTAGQAEALWRLDRPEEALSLLRRRESSVGAEDEAFWRLLGTLARNLEDDPAALHAYQTLWNSGRADQADVEHLISLQVAAGSAQNAIDTARQARPRFGDDRFLLLALQLALKEAQWEKLEALLGEASTSPLAEGESYWLLRAELMRHKKVWPEVAASYERALALNPPSVAARTGLLWTLIELRQYPRLAEHLRAWEADAESDSRYWGAYAAGLDAMGRTGEALPWFERHAKASPDDLLWLLSYADALARTGREDSAWRLRRHALGKLGQKMGRGKTGTTRTRALQLAYSRLLGEFGYADAQANQIRQLEAENPVDAAAIEYLAGHYLAERQFDAARRWLLKAHAQRRSLPDWQELTIALADHDEATVRRILESPDSRLDPVTKVAAWKQIGAHEQALLVAQQSLDAESDGRYSGQLRSEITDLVERHSNKIGAGWRYDRLGSLGINEYSALLAVPDQPANDWATSFRFARRHLSSSSDQLNVSQYPEEIDIMANLSGPLLGGKLESWLGGNVRDDSSLVYARLGWTLPLSEGELWGKIQAGYNELPLETSYLRALGVKDSVSFELLGRITARNFARIRTQFQQYNTRDQDFLGRGFFVEGDINHTVFFDRPFWQIKLQAGWMGNNLANSVPTELLSLGLSPSVTIQEIVPQEYGMLGVGNYLRLGSAPGPNLSLEAWTGYVWPAKEFAYNVRLSTGTSLLTRDDRLSIDAFYTNAQSGQPGQAFQGIGAFYQLAF
jgi:hypothetical protein